MSEHERFESIVTDPESKGGAITPQNYNKQGKPVTPAPEEVDDDGR